LPRLDKNMKNEIISKLSSYIAREIVKDPSRSFAPDEPLLSSGMVDSFSLVDLALFIEDTFGVRIEDTELNVSTFDTLDQLAGIVQSRM
jgi:acyl carrier protein